MVFTKSFVSYIRSFCERSSSQEEIHQIKRCILDWLSVTQAGAYILGNRLDCILNLSSAGRCSCFLSSEKKDLITAAFLNGFAAHEIELDDGHRRAMLHLEAPIVSAMIAVSQQESLSFEDFVKGIIAGYQTTVKLARMIQPGHKMSGFHATGTCSAIGVASAVAMALGMTEDEHTNAIAAATTRAAGLLAALDSPSELKPYNIAGAIEVGIRSAYLAKGGFKGVYDALYGKRGFLKVFAPGIDPVVDGLDNTSELLNIYFKPYVSCRHCHAPIEAALNIRNKNHLDWRDCKDIRVDTYRLAIDGHDSKVIKSSSEAKMSIPYCVAVSLVKGSCGMDSFTDGAVIDNDVQLLLRTISVQEDSMLTQATPNKRGARVIVELKDGRKYIEFVENPLGEPEHPMSDAMIESKYMELMSFAGVEESRMIQMKNLVWSLEDHFDVFLQVI
jgi:2-methylcitrate dehydratase PrpD